MISLNSPLKNSNSDFIGAFASGLCLIHCIATPFIFIAQSCSATCCDSAPTWWKAIDFLFIIISFFAVYFSAKESSKYWMKYALYSSWFLLLLVIINERIELLHLPEGSVYIPAIALIGFHLYNKKYCQCNDKHCTTSLS
ncbi:MAG: MerC domain-containing protein [Winogradskyella sp.]|uniref:MerC domain-containing protein n=1 Tax=Winogradskyella sp. TaxID=1883156 RepID=UPI0025CE042A|nr:MerC domain-containing protein [Winogradskyella sp.]NRB60346.1 MerC domain-containing protein [Winogradskyella sp.]